jgi:hypothetical protein
VLRDYCRLPSLSIYASLQATNLGLAIEKIDQMLRWRLSDEPLSTVGCCNA